MSTHPEIQYLKLIYEILKKGRTKKGQGIHPMKSIFGYQMKFDLRRGFPILTTKKMPIKVMINELLWFISGDTNIRSLQERGIHYWDGFADSKGDLGPVYGSQWRKWPVFIPVDSKGVERWDLSYSHNDVISPSMFPAESEIVSCKVSYIDQLANVIEGIKKTPDSKALIVSAWNPAFNPRMRLPACHTFFQFDVRKGKLRLQLYQRSGDVFLGIPFNITQYSLLLMMVAKLTGLEAREFIISIGDAHLYHNHIEVAKEQLRRKPHPFPKMEISGSQEDIDSFKLNDFELINYKFHPHIKGDLIIV